MKKYVFWLVLLFCVLTLPGIGHAAGNTHINLDGKDLSLTSDKQVQVVNNSVMVPIRVVAEELGYNVGWNEKTNTVTIQQSGKILKLVIGQRTATVDGSSVQLIAPPITKNNYTYVPLRFVGEQLGLKVSWDNVKKTVYLVSNEVVEAPAKTQITGISFSENKLVVAVSGNVSPKLSKLSSPDRIVMDLPGTRFADSFGSNYPLGTNQNGEISVAGYPDVSKVRYSLFDSKSSTTRIVLDLNYAKSYDFINDNDGLLVIDLNNSSGPGTSDPVTPPTSGGKKLVVIDAGHGGKDPGAISITKKKEKDFTLAVVLKVEALLKKEPNIRYVLTRSGDTYPTLSDRANLANNLGADLFVSVHANSGSSSASGVETLYTRSSSAAFAKVMHKHLLQSTGLPDRKVQVADLHVTRETKMPAVLLECGFLSNKSDEAKMYTSAFQQEVAEGIVAGIKEYLGIK